MAPSVAEIPEEPQASIIVPVKTIPEKTEAATETKIEEVTETKAEETEVKTEATEAKPKVRRIIDEEGGKTTATVRQLLFFLNFT